MDTRPIANASCVGGYLGGNTIALYSYVFYDLMYFHMNDTE